MDNLNFVTLLKTYSLQTCFFHLIKMNGDILHILIGPQQHYLNQWCEFRAGLHCKKIYSIW